MRCRGGSSWVAAAAWVAAWVVAAAALSSPPPPSAPVVRGGAEGGALTGGALAALGARPLAPAYARALWEALVKAWGGEAWLVPEGALRQAGFVLSGAPPEALRNLSITDADTVASLGQPRGLDAAQLSALAEHVSEDWLSKRPDEYSHLDLGALRQLLCGFRPEALRRLRPQAYKEAAGALAALRGCPREALAALARLATHPEAFGDPLFWTDAQVRSIGCVLGGLPVPLFASIPDAAMEGMLPTAVQCVTSEQIAAMTSAQFKRLVASAKSGLTNEQKAALSKDKRVILDSDKAKIPNKNCAPWPIANKFVPCIISFTYILHKQFSLL